MLPFSKRPEDVATCIAFLDKLKEIYKTDTDIDAIYDSLASINYDDEVSVPTIIGYRNGTSVGLIHSPDGRKLAKAIIQGVEADIAHNLTTSNDVVALRRIFDKTYLGEGEVTEYLNKVGRQAKKIAEAILRRPEGFPKLQIDNYQPEFRTETKRIRRKKLETHDLLKQAEPIRQHILRECSKPNMTQPELNEADVQRLLSYKVKVPFMVPTIGMYL